MRPTTILAAATLALAAAANAQTITTFIPPISPSGWNIGGISQDGSVVAGTAWNGGTYAAFRYTTPGGVQMIPGISGYAGNHVSSLSRDGLVLAGNVGFSGPNPTGTGIGFRWTQAGGNVQVGPFANAPTEVYGMSGDGNTIHGRVRQPNGSMRAFKWTQSGGLNLLPQVAGGFNSYVRATTPDGLVAIGDSEVGGIPRPVVWTGNTLTADLSPLYAGNAYVTAISDDALTVWGYNLAGPNQLFRYRNIGTWVRDTIGNYPATNVTYPGPIVPDGTAILGSYYNSTTFLSGNYLWSTTLGWQNLPSWLTSVGFNLGSLQINSIAALSADGTAMTGRGQIGSQQVIWVARGVPCLHIPEVTQSPPTEIEICRGATATMAVTAGGNYRGTSTYQWKKNGVAVGNGPTGSGSTISGATTNTLTITNSQVSDTAPYVCTVTNPCGAVTTQDSNLYVLPRATLDAAPAPAVVCGNGGSAAFYAMSSNATTRTWQWFNGSTWLVIGNGGFFDLGTGVSWSASGAGTDTLQLTSVQFGPFLTIPIRFSVANQCAAVRPIETSMSLHQPMDITGANDQYYCHFTPAVFNTSVGSGSPTGFNWQILDPTFNVWLYLNNGLYIDGFTGISANVSGVFSTSLSFDIIAPGTQPNALQFRCAVSDECGWEFSTPGTLTICRGDFNCDLTVDFFDYLDFVDAYSANAANADHNGDGFIDFFDYLDFVDAYSAGC